MSESIGAKLRQTREQRHLTLEQVSETTKIRKHYLEALENDDLSAISSTAQARGFLRLYADSLGLDMNTLVPTPRPVEPPPPPAPEPPAISPEVPADSASRASSSPKATSASQPEGPVRPSFLAGLRERFTRKPSEESAKSQKESEVSDQNRNPEPEAFVPARVTEELPAQPVPVHEEPSQDESQESKPATTNSRTKRRSTARPKRTSKTVREKDEKKNVNG